MFAALEKMPEHFGGARKHKHAVSPSAPFRKRTAGPVGPGSWAEWDTYLLNHIFFSVIIALSSGVNNTRQ